MNSMAEGKIILSGFKLDPAEKAIIDNLIKNYKHKIQEKIGFKEIRLRMKRSLHGKTYLHEVQGTLLTNRMFKSKVEDYNLFSAISDVFEKLMNEAYHSIRK
jgi:hypothetical protein